MQSSFDGCAGADIFSAASTATFSCRNCARRTEFEQPPCPDGHDSDCPEWYCTECGAATILGRQSTPRRRRGSRTRPSVQAARFTRAG